MMNFFFLLTIYHQCIKDFWEGRPQIKLWQSKSLFTRAADMIFKKSLLEEDTRVVELFTLVQHVVRKIGISGDV